MVTTPPSMPVTSEIAITLREPSGRRDCWTMMWIAEAICSRIARLGSSMPASSTRVSMRAMQSRGELEWIVVSEPS